MDSTKIEKISATEVKVTTTTEVIEPETNLKQALAEAQKDLDRLNGFIEERKTILEKVIKNIQDKLDVLKPT
jgi:hypothetical protein